MQILGFPYGSRVTNLPANAGDSRDAGSIPGLERSPGVGNGNLLQDSCPQNPMNKGAYGTVAPQTPSLFVMESQRAGHD